MVTAELWTAVAKGSRTEENHRRFERLLDGLPEVGQGEVGSEPAA